MILYRYEHPTTKCGPYTHKWFSAYELMEEHERLEKSHPLPQYDGLTEMLDTERTGMVSIQALEEWFSASWRQRFKSEGFHLYKYTVLSCNCRTSITGQILFDVDSVTSKTKIDWSTL